MLDRSEVESCHGFVVLSVVRDAGRVLYDRSPNNRCRARTKDIDLVNPHLVTTVTQSDKTFRVRITSKKPAHWTWLNLDELDVRYSDNFVHT